MDGKISKQRVYCKIRAQLGFPPTEIHADLQKVYGNGALKYAAVFYCENANLGRRTSYRARDRRIKWHSFVKCFEDLT